MINTLSVMKKYIILLAGLVAFVYAAGAQEPGQKTEVNVIDIDAPNPEPIADSLFTRPWTLARCISWARENNIQILQKGLSIDESELAARQTRLDYIPSLNASANSSTSFGNSYDPVSQNSQESYTSISASASVSTDVFAGLRKLHSMRRSDLSLKETLLSIEKAKNDLTLNVTASYLDILFAEEKLAIAETQIGVLEMQVARSRKQLDAGAATLGDLLQIQSQLADAKHQKLLTENQRVLAYFNLCQLLEIEDFMSFRIVAPEAVVILTDMSISSAQEIIDVAQSLPEIEGARLGIEIAKKDIRIAKADYYPTLRFSIGYGSNYADNMKLPDPDNPGTYLNERYPFFDQMKNHAGASANLSLSIPIFNSLRTRNAVKTKQVALRRADYNLQLAQKQLSKEIQQAFIDAHGALEQYNSTVSNVETYEESFRMVDQKFNLGAATPVDYGVALYNLVNARAELSQAKYQFIFKTKILDFYKGIPIDLQ